MNLEKLLETVDKSTLEKTPEYLVLHGFTKANIQRSDGKPRDALAAYKKANAIKLETVQGEFDANLKIQAAYTGALSSAPILNIQPDFDTETPTSIFILGPSRSGKSTLERLLAQFSSVQRGYESPIVKSTAIKVSAAAGLPRRDFAFQLPATADQAFRNLYADELAYRIKGKSHFTVTLPNVVVDAYHLARIIPNSRFIFVRRDIEDVVYRMYCTTYEQGNYHCYNLDKARAHTKWYCELQQTLVKNLPGISMTVNYEDMVIYPLKTTRAVSSFCGLRGEIGSLPDIGNDTGFAQQFINF